MCLSLCETVWAACFMWAACITTINTALSQTKWILRSSEIEHISPKARCNCATYSGVIILSRNTVWSCSLPFYGRMTLWIQIVCLSFLHPGEFYFKTTFEASAKNKNKKKTRAVYLSADISSHLVRPPLSFAFLCCSYWQAFFFCCNKRENYSFPAVMILDCVLRSPHNIGLDLLYDWTPLSWQKKKRSQTNNDIPNKSKQVMMSQIPKLDLFSFKLCRKIQTEK